MYWWQILAKFFYQTFTNVFFYFFHFLTFVFNFYLNVYYIYEMFDLAVTLTLPLTFTLLSSKPNQFFCRLFTPINKVWWNFVHWFVRYAIVLRGLTPGRSYGRMHGRTETLTHGSTHGRITRKHNASVEPIGGWGIIMNLSRNRKLPSYRFPIVFLTELQYCEIKKCDIIENTIKIIYEYRTS